MNKIDLALQYAKEKHKDQKRKVTNEPYINHIMDVCEILKESNADEQTIIVGILHDTIEDTTATYDEIKNFFGKNIADLVNIESEIKSLPYRERKAEHMERVGNASRQIKMVNCADKVSNLKSMIKIYEKYKDKIWQFFNGTKEDIYWYYTLALEKLNEIKDEKVYQDFCELYKIMFIDYLKF